MHHDVYETQEMSSDNALAFKQWFDQTIGTDMEKNPAGNGHFYFICLELAPQEIEKIRNWKNRIDKTR